jgi:hypothetical protein
MTGFIRALTVSGLWLTCAASALADSFFLRYDGDETFPEEEGWTRSSGNQPDGKVVRTLEDGIFRINSMESFDWDVYQLASPSLVPEPTELLRVDWRMRVLQQGATDVPDWFGEAGMYIRVNGYASFHLSPDSVSVRMPEYPDYQLLALEPGAWHTYSFLTNAQHYDLFVDGQVAFQSNHRESETPYPIILWGDTWSGGTGGSESEWDYVQVSIVPEPGGLLIGAVAVLAFPSTGRQGVIT